MDTALPNASQNRSHTFAKMSTQCCDFRMKAGNGIWQHLLGRMSQNSWLRTDAEVGALGARQEVGTGASSPSSEGGWTGTITHTALGPGHGLYGQVLNTRTEPMSGKERHLEKSSRRKVTDASSWVRPTPAFHSSWYVGRAGPPIPPPTTPCQVELLMPTDHLEVSKGTHRAGTE